MRSVFCRVLRADAPAPDVIAQRSLVQGPQDRFLLCAVDSRQFLGFFQGPPNALLTKHLPTPTDAVRVLNR